MTLAERMRVALWGMYWLSNGSTMRMDANRVTQSKDRPGFPAGDGFPLVDEFAVRWRGARTWNAKRDVVQEAEKALQSARRQPEPEDREFERGSLAWKRRIANDDRGTAEVARLYTVSRHQVCGFRSQYREDEAA